MNDLPDLAVEPNLSFGERPITIVDINEKQFRCKTVRIVRVSWRHHSPIDSTWEMEDQMRERFSYLFDPEEVLQMANFPKAQKFLRKMGLGKKDRYFWKQMGKAVLCTYTLMGAAWFWNEKSPLGWWTLMPRPKEEKEMAHLYERRKFPYPGDKEAVDEFIASGSTLGTTIGPKGFVDSTKDADNFQKQLQNKKFDQEAQKMWFRMRNEVIQELQDKGFDVE